MSAIEDPFVSNLEGAHPRETHRYSSFDTQLFSLDASSPAQAKRALEAHLAETERRLEEAGKLGTALIEQQKELEDKLKEVEQQQEAGQIGPELRRKLADLEREYNEIGRETARAFLAPKRLAGDDGHFGTPYEQKSPISPALFASQATNSPSKVSVPSRKQRNQPSSRVHDIEFATEISTSLLAQVRQLQTMLAEREEALRTLNLEKSRLELEAEGYAQRIRALDESEERYKDENWALETRTHELTTAVKEAADREDRLNSSLSVLTTEKNTMDRELEDLKQINAKLIEDQTVAQKANDAEIHLLRRNLNAGDVEKLALQQKLEELNSQNQELAKAVAMRLRQHETESTRESTRGHDSDDQDQSTPDNSPPPSPSKFTPRHNHLETETLRSSLGHAHRMIQNLKSTIHREKTEKIDLKRMLQDARDEIEQRRREAAAPANQSNKRQKTKVEPARKAPRPDLLGAGRKQAEVEIHDSDWEDNATDGTPPHKSTMKSSRGRKRGQSSDEPSDAYQTATEADDAFETANERETATESDAFQTGVESMADDSTDTDELTETEDRLQRTPRGRRVSSLTMAKTRGRISYQSSASASGDEDEDELPAFSSPSQVSTPRYRLRQKRSVSRKIRPSGEAPMASSSRPSSARESPATSFDRGLASGEGQSLFMELADLDGDEENEGDFGPPMRYDTASPSSTPRMLATPDSRRPSDVMLDAPRKPVMVDSGVMTEPWSPEVVSEDVSEVPNAVSVEAARDVPTAPKATMSDASTATEMEKTPELAHVGTQWTPLEETEEHTDDVVAIAQPKDLGRPTVEMEMDVSSVAFQETVPVAPRLPQLSTSYSVAVATEPVKYTAPERPEITLSSISSQGTTPVVAKFPEPKPVYVADMSISNINFEHTVPVVPALPEPTPAVSLVEHATNTETPELSVSLIFSQQTEPVEAVLEKNESVPAVLVDHVETPVELPELTFSSIFSQETQPVVAVLEQEPASDVVEQVETKELPELEFAVSSIFSQQTEPVEAIVERSEPTSEVVVEAALPDLAISYLTPECTEPVSLPAREVFAPQVSLSNVSSVETLPVEPSHPTALIPGVQLPDETTKPAPTASRSLVESTPGSGIPSVVIAEDSSDEATADDIADSKLDGSLPLGAISGNTVPRHVTPHPSGWTDQGAQTILSSKQIDQLLMDRITARPLSPPDSDKAKEQNSSPFATPKARTRPAHQPSVASLPSQHKRPGSAVSQTSSIQSHPPLPADHKEAIMAAEKRSLDQRPASPSLMGPPLAPASAFRTNAAQRPRTPNESGLLVGPITTTTSRGKVRRESHVSRRSSVSSFASEVDERFNANHNPVLGPGYVAGTDPRMIQAITQTMIGEFLWKYTRKTVTGEISNSRHRRYFWVHPYTRTLYWSESDPQSAGKSELRTKSVAIEAVRVVPDDNPYPPGLHCKSLEVVSPGRRIRFTATTSQRHETWFNALSYLLLRNSENGEEQDQDASLEDIDEFNPGFRTRSRQTSRLSFSSSRSRNSRNWPKQRAGSTMSARRTATPGRASPALSTPSNFSDQRNGSASRLSTILNTTIKGSFGRKGPNYASSSMHEGSIHTHDHDSDEDFRHMDRDERLENVRACCDGKHDVGALSRTSRYSPRVNRIHSHH